MASIFAAWDRALDTMEPKAHMARQYIVITGITQSYMIALYRYESWTSW